MSTTKNNYTYLDGLKEIFDILENPDSYDKEEGNFDIYTSGGWDYCELIDILSGQLDKFFPGTQGKKWMTLDIHREKYRPYGKAIVWINEEGELESEEFWED